LDYVIYALDIAILSEALKPRNTSWVKLNSSGDIESVGYNLAELAHDIASEIKNYMKIALGFEAPMWIPIPQINDSHQFKMSGRFYNELNQNSIRWFEGGAAPLVKTLPIGYFLFSQILKHSPKIVATTDLSDWENAQIYLFEGFAAGKYKGVASSQFIDFKKENKKLSNDDLVDAFIIGSAFYQKHNNNYVPLLNAIKWDHHLEATNIIRSDGNNIIRTIHKDIHGTTLPLVSHDCDSHHSYISIWNIIKDEVISRNAEKEAWQFIITNPLKACDIYGFKFS
jgi:hypothetical protein